MRSRLIIIIIIIIEEEEEEEDEEEEEEETLGASIGLFCPCVIDVLSIITLKP